MATFAYQSPFIPPEWIAAHGWSPCRVFPASLDREGLARLTTGVCPYSRAFLEGLSRLDPPPDAVGMTTACDQMRRGFEDLRAVTEAPGFLLNVPATWETPVAARMYREELARLGRFLVTHGGTAPTPARLREVMEKYHAAREQLRGLAGYLDARAFVQLLAEFPNNGHCTVPALPMPGKRASTEGMPIAILGGPLLHSDLGLLSYLESRGARLALDASESGERAFPLPLNRRRLREDPQGELADAYFGAIPTVWRRPNTQLFTWLRDRIAERGIRGIVLRRYLWCDLWHGEVDRFKEWLGVPLLDLDSGGAGDEATEARTRTRIDAFMDSLT